MMKALITAAALAIVSCISYGQDRSNASRQTPPHQPAQTSAATGSRATNHASDNAPRQGSPSYVASPGQPGPQGQPGQPQGPYDQPGQQGRPQGPQGQQGQSQGPRGNQNQYIQPQGYYGRQMSMGSSYYCPGHGYLGLYVHQPYATMTAEYHRQQSLSLAGMPIYTFYDINSVVGGGMVLDTSMRRPTIETLLDTYYRPSISRIESAHMPPYPEKGKDDPFLDDTHSIFGNHYTTLGYDADLANATDHKDAVVMELFGFSPIVPYDVVEPVRAAVYKGFLARGRHYVMDAQTILGGVYDGSPVYYGGKPGTVFHFTPRMEKLYCAGVRYVVSGYVSQYYTRTYHQSKTSTSLTFESMLTLHLTAYDLDTKTILQTKVITLHNTGSTQARADMYLYEMVDNHVDDFYRDNFRIITTMGNLGNYKKSGKAKSCIISSGRSLGIHQGDGVEVYTPGKTSMTWLGSLRVTSEISDESAACVISFGAKKVTEAINNGAELILLTD